MGIFQQELTQLEAKWRESEQAKQQMKSIVDEFEKTMSKMIGLTSVKTIF